MCICNKNLKKLKYLVKPHESFLFGIWFVSMAFSGKNPICNTVKHSKLQFLTVSAISKELGFFFFTKNIANVLYLIFSVGFIFFFRKNYSIYQVSTFYFCFNCLLTSRFFCQLFDALLFADRRLIRKENKPSIIASFLR